MLASPKNKRFARFDLRWRWLAAGVGLAFCLLLGGAPAQAVRTALANNCRPQRRR